MQDMQLLDQALFQELIERARQTRRLRINHNFHRSMEENPHRFLNVMLRGTYIAPHRHLGPPKPEAFLVLEGKIGFFEFLR
jgi:cupin fold WbuC family metalloprotein